ncbi:MAG: hypothetical protein IPO36_14650 [Anaerolineales bacterium]|nr:hypothetical protein [Anaerolineales bacterium]
MNARYGWVCSAISAEAVNLGGFDEVIIFQHQRDGMLNRREVFQQAGNDRFTLRSLSITACEASPWTSLAKGPTIEARR